MNRLLRTLGVGLTAALFACSSEPACTDCATVEGSYGVTFDNGVLGKNGDCSQFATLAEGGLDLSRIGSKLTGDYLGVALSGTLSQNLNLTLTGTRLQNGASTDGGVGDSDTLTFQLRYVAPSGTPAGPTRLTGSVTKTSSRPNSSGASAACSQTGSVTATRP